MIHAQDISHHSHYIIVSSSAVWSAGSLGSRACVPNLFTWPATYLIFTEINTYYLFVDLFHLNNMVGHGMELCHMWHWKDNNLSFTIPGVGFENIKHQGSHFFNSKGVFFRLVQLKLRRGMKCILAVIKELNGLLLWICFWIYPFILSYSQVLHCWRGWLQLTNTEMFLMQELVWGLWFKDKRRRRGFQKLSITTQYLFSKSPAPGFTILYYLKI